MTRRTGLRLAAILAAMLTLAGCTGLPTSGPPNAGLAVGEDGGSLILTPVAEGPQPGESPEQIVEGFLDASKTPANSWEIARQFLTSDFSQQWKPEAGVSIDESIVDRQFTPDVEGDVDDATTAEVRVQLEQVASVGPDGVYSAAGTGAAKALYRLVRVDGEWRISEGNDGITLDVDTFEQVYAKYSLKYFDQNWSHLVSDVRWFPRRAAIATTIAREVISGSPAEWLAPAVRTAFASDVALVGDSVTVDESQVASVPLTRAALSASPVELARMRTQLEASLAGAGIAQVRLVVDGVPLDTDRAPIDEVIVDPGVLVLTKDGFGTATSGAEPAPVGRLTAQLAKIADPIASIDVSADALLAAVQLRDGRVYAVGDGNNNQLGTRTGLITPTLDPFGFTWTVPSAAPTSVQAWSADVKPHDLANAWPKAESISHMRVSADGAKVAAVVSEAGQRKLVVAAILRDESQTPVELGDPHEVARLKTQAQGIAWIGSDSIAVLSTVPDPVMGMFVLGGPATMSPAPADAVSVAGARTLTGLRVLSSDGAVSAQRGSFWQESIRDVLVLGTRAGY